MRKIILPALLTMTTVVFAQNREITFEHGNLASVFAKAKKENKLIFIDAYTTWCGPCKWMAKNIFTNDTVADFYNAKYVNYKLDMEKGEGLDFAKKYQVNCYPNLLVLNDKGELIHRGAGGLPVLAFIEFGKAGYSSDKNFASLQTKYDPKNLTENNIQDYAQLLKSCCLDPSPEINAYLNSLGEEDLLKRNNWVLYRDYDNRTETKAYTYFIKNHEKFSERFGNDTIESKILKLGKAHFNKHIYAKAYDEKAYENAKSEFKKLDFPMSETILMNTDLSVYQRFDTKKYYPLAATYHLKYSMNNAGNLNSIAWQFYEKVDDVQLLEDALKMSVRACELKKEYYMFEDTQAALLYKLKRYSDAEKMANTAIASAKKQNMAEDEYKETIDLLNKIKQNLK